MLDRGIGNTEHGGLNRSSIDTEADGRYNVSTNALDKIKMIHTNCQLGMNKRNEINDLVDLEETRCTCFD